MLKSALFGLSVPVVVALLTAASGCTVTTNGTDTPDGSTPVTPTGDGAASSGVLGFHPSNLGDLLATLDLSKVGDVDVPSVGAGPGLACAVAGGDSCVKTTLVQSDGSTANVYVAKSWKIEPTGELIASDSAPTILVALTTIEVLGKISATATGESGTAGGYSAAAGELPGAGPGGGGASHEASGVAIGAGGASHCGIGGKGGNASGSFGLGGATYGSATVVPLQGGSAGGGGNSGGGGGALQLVAGTSITIASGGAVSAGGGGGYFGSGPGSGANAGGSGGALLLEAPVVTVLGAIAANGGGGSGGGAAQGNSTGADATPNATPAVGGATGTAGAGGDGSGESGAGSDGAPGDASYGAGGGGGGAGWIRINTQSGAAAITGTLSPAATTSCATQGTLS